MMNILVVDVGGSHVKILAPGQDESRKFSSGPKMTAKRMVAGVKDVTGDWKYDVVSIGYPGVVLRDRVVSEPNNLNYVVLGGGNVKKLKKLPPGCRAGDNADAFQGGFRMWEKARGDNLR